MACRKAQTKPKGQNMMNEWIQSLPGNTDVFGRYDWTGAQVAAAHAQYAADRQAYSDLLTALETADASLAGVANDCALENMRTDLTFEHLGFWREMRRQLASAAGQIWENAGRNVNAETGKTIY